MHSLQKHTECKKWNENFEANTVLTLCTGHRMEKQDYPEHAVRLVRATSTKRTCAHEELPFNGEAGNVCIEMTLAVVMCDKHVSVHAAEYQVALGIWTTTKDTNFLNKVLHHPGSLVRVKVRKKKRPKRTPTFFACTLCN